MKRRKVLALLLCAALLTTTAAALGVPPKQPLTVLTGTVAQNLDGSLLVDSTAMGQVIVLMDEHAPIIDAVSAQAVTIADVAAGQSVQITIAPALALSDPPRARGLAMVSNLPADYKAPEYKTIGHVEPVDGSKDGVLAQVFSDDGLLMGRVTVDTEMLRYTKSGEVAIKSLPTMGEVVPGCGMFVWYGASTRSIPAQTTFDRLLLVPSTYDGYVSAQEGTFSRNGVNVMLSEQPVQTESGELLLPLRAVAEAAGWTIGWAGKDQDITLSHADGASFSLHLGSTTVRLDNGDGHMTFDLGQPTQLQGEVTYVDSALLELAMNLYLAQ